jgi:hypothetical protein
MESARRKEFLRWLKLLQFDRNILCYGIGSKQLLIRNFAATALQDEDVIELSASMLQDKDSSSSLPSLFSAGGAHWKRNGEEVLWNLFHLIRRGILSSSSQGSRIPPSTIWSRKSDGSVYPLESEARLVSGDPQPHPPSLLYLTLSFPPSPQTISVCITIGSGREWEGGMSTNLRPSAK